jgi:TolB protein
VRVVIGSAVLFLTVLVSAGEAGGRPSGRAGLSRGNGLIAYESDVAGPLEVFVMNPDGSKKRQLTHSRQNGEPRWSPDGQRIVFVHGGCSTVGCAPTRSALWIMNADGSGQRRLTNGRSVDNDGRWSPDGRWIAFSRGTSCTGDGCKIDIWLIRPDGTDARRVTHDGRSTQPTWSPDGKKIAFSCDNADGSRSDICVMNADGTGRRDLTSGLPANSALCSEPAWSPDGHTILFAYGQPSRVLIFMSSNGLTPTAPVFSDHPGGDYYSEPAWSPDGTKIAFERQQTIAVVSVRPQGKAKTVAFDGDNHNPDWQPLPRSR